MRHALMRTALGVLFAALFAGAAFAQDRLHVYNWNNYITEDTVARFETACRCRLVQDYYADNEEMLAKLAAGAAGYDILVPTGDAVATLIRQGALRPIEREQLPKLANLKPEFLGLWFDPGNRYSVPYAYSITLLGYNAQKMRELGIPTDSWAAIFEPKHLERLRGKVTVLDSQRELMAAALIYLGFPAYDTDPGHWRQARDLILRAKPYWAAFNAASYIKELTVGNIWLAHGYSNDMHTARQDALKAGRKFEIAYTAPKEGGGVRGGQPGPAQKRPAARSRAPVHRLPARGRELGRAFQRHRRRQPECGGDATDPAGDREQYGDLSRPRADGEIAATARAHPGGTQAAQPHVDRD